MEVARLRRELDEARAARNEGQPDITAPTEGQRDLEVLASFPAENPNPSIRVAGDGKILYANAAAKTLLSHFNGGTGEALPGPWRRVVGDAIQAGTPAGIEIPHDGRVFSFVIVPVRGTAYANWYGHDVTRLKRAERLLRESEERYRSLVNVSPDAIIVNRQNKLVLINEAGLKLFGATKPEQMLGKSPFDIVHPDYRAVVRQRIRRMLELGQAAPLIEVKICRLDGTLRTVQVTAAPVMYQGVLSAQAVLRDVTEQKEAEGRLRRREAELAHLSRVYTVGEMATALAHELNQPLQAINNYVRGAQRRLKNPGAAADLAPIVDAMERVSTEVGRAAAIVSHLRDFIRGREPQRSSVDVGVLLQQALGLLQAMACDKSVVIELEFLADLPAARADAIQVEQVVVNLVTNAVDAAAGLPPERRKVTVAARPAESGGVEIAVRDYGRGVPENLKGRLFEPFVTTKENGLGFGLAISRSIVESHGGKMWVVHQEPHGVAFHFTLPLAVGSQGDCSNSRPTKMGLSPSAGQEP